MLAFYFWSECECPAASKFPVLVIKAITRKSGKNSLLENSSLKLAGWCSILQFCRLHRGWEILTCQEATIDISLFGPSAFAKYQCQNSFVRLKQPINVKKRLAFACWPRPGVFTSGLWIGCALAMCWYAACTRCLQVSLTSPSAIVANLYSKYIS